MSKKKKKELQDLALCEGLALDKSFFSQKENRLHTLWIKGLIVYLIVMGSMGSYLTAVGSRFSGIAVHVAIFVIAMFCAMLYYGKLVENIGYLALLAVMVSSGLGLKSYINSGFYGVINDTLGKASEYFNLSGVKSYGEQISNRYLAITVSMIFIGGILCILLNVLISRRMQYLVVTLIVIPLLGIPLYMEAEPNTLYMLMLLCGILFLYMFRGSKHYKITTDNHRYCVEKKHHISYVYHGKSLARIFLMVGCGVVVFTMVVSVIVPKGTFGLRHGSNEFKNNTKEEAKNLVTLGIAGLLNYYPNTGGVNSGKLGGVGTINLDYNTDLLVRFAPYDYNRIYLKSFTGVTYQSFENRWTRMYERILLEDSQNKEVELLKSAYDTTYEKAARGTLEVENIAGPIGYYSPYYSVTKNEEIAPNETATYQYYPSFGEGIQQEEYTLDEQQQEVYTTVPLENEKNIEEFSKKAGFKGTNQQIIQQVVEYFQKNIPYTLSPGATPQNADFVNYFLEKSKKGYCIHYASAATLIFRSLGIPARYVEGYAIDYDQVIDGNLVKGKTYQEYYDGYSVLGETGVVEVEVRDADAHAWVEVFSPGFGWKVVEVTPSSAEGMPRQSFWSVFMNLFGSDTTSSSNKGDEKLPTNTKEVGESFIQNTGRVVICIIVFIAFVLIGVFAFKRVKFAYKFQKANRNDKLIMAYSRYLKKIGKKDRAINEKLNYQEQVEYLVEQNVWKLSAQQEKQAVHILEIAGFSQNEIDAASYAQVLRYIK